MAEHTLHGIAVSSGISIGKAFFRNRSRYHLIPRQTLSSEFIEDEVARLADAFNRVREELQSAVERIPPDFRQHAAILNSHLMISNDPRLEGSAKKFVREMGITAEWALEKALGELETAFNAISNQYIRERFQDVRAVTDRVLAKLQGDPLSARAIESRVVLVAHDLTPADTAELEVDKIMAFATAEGGKTSHSGILARSLQIPAVVGVGDLETTINDGDLVIVDGFKGLVLVNPDETELARYADLKYQFESYLAAVIRHAHLPAETIDGFHIEVMGNIELFEEVAQVINNGGEGVGLYRTEFAFMNRRELPSEEELVEEYRELAELIAPRRVILRTLDVGADKVMLGQDDGSEPNPALGLRAIRFCLHHEDLFKRQLRAILRAAASGNVALMFPMISGLTEVRQAKNILQVCIRELRAQGLPHAPHLPVGIMIELPSAVMIAEILAQEVDFFSIGTNDLIQYSLGIDRTNKRVSYLYQPLHPAVVRSLKHVVDMGHQAGIQVSVCGELASDPYCVPILMGMQIDCISITPQAIPGIKRIIRRTTMQECKQLMKRVLGSKTVSHVNRHVKDTIFKRFPEEVVFYSSLLDQEED